MSGSNEQQQQQPDLNALIQQMIRQQMAAASGQQQVQLPSLPTSQAQTQYSNDPEKGPDLLQRIGLALGGGALPGAPAELRAQMGSQGLLNFGIGLMSAGRFATPGEVFAGGLRGAQAGLLGNEAALAGQQEYALNAQTKMAELAAEQQKNRTAALTALVPLLQMQGRLGLPPLFGPGSGAGGPGGGPGAGEDIYSLPKDEFLAAVAKRESGGDPTALNYVAKVDPTAYARGATASGKYQMVNSTWLTAAKGAGIDTAKYPTAMSAPEALQDKAASWLYDNQGTAPWNPSKFGAAWVPTPTGQFILAHKVPGAAPPGGPPVASPPSDGKLPAPPSKPTPARPVGPFGAGAFAPPTTTVAAPPDTTANAPNVGTALPVPTPAMTAARAEVARTGKAAPVGDTGLWLQPNGNLGLGPNAGGLGRRADADAILQGVQTAQTTLPPADTVATAGPGAGGGGTPPGAQPAPDSAFGGGAFATAPPHFVGPVTAPAAPAQPPAAQPPATTPAAPTPTPAATQPAATAPTQPAGPPVSLEEYAQRHGAGTLDQPNPASVQAADANIAAAQRQLNEIRRGALPGDLNKAMSDVQAAQNERDKLFSDAREKFYSSIVMPGYKAEVLDPRNAAALETQRGETQKDIERIKTGAELQRTLMQPDLDRLKTMGTQSDEMTNLAVNLQQLRAILPNLPEAGWGAAIAQHLSPAAMGWMQAAGLGDPKQMNAVQALNGLAAYLSVQMRPTGSGALRNQEMDRFMQALPNLAQGAAGREKAVAFLLNYANRVQDENQFANEYFHRPKADGSPALNLIGVERAMNAPKSQGGLGEVVPHAPPLSAGPQAAQTFLSGIDSGRPYYAWVPKVDKSGTPIRNERGQVVYDYDLAVKP